MLLRIVRELKVAKFVGISGRGIGTQCTMQNNSVQSLLDGNDLIQQGFRLSRESHRRAAVGFFSRFTHADIISDFQAPFVFFVIFNILWLTWFTTAY